jgi:hypothetical protein
LECVVYRCDVKDDGFFINIPETNCSEMSNEETWRKIVEEVSQVSGLHVHVVCPRRPALVWQSFSGLSLYLL